MNTDRLDQILRNWARWTVTRGLTEFHVMAKSVGEGFTHYSLDREGEYAKIDNWVSENVDAIVRDLRRLEQRALTAEYLRTAWVEAFDIEPVLVVAREGVRMGLCRRDIV